MRSESLRSIVDGLLTLPMVLPPTVAGFFLLYVFGVQRPLGKLLSESFSIRVLFNWPATVIAAVVISFPLMYRSARGAFEQLDVDLIYAARTIGMSEWRIFWRVMVPMAAPGVATGGILAFARGLGEFGATAMIAGNIQGQTRTLPLAVYSAVAAGDMEGAYGYVAILVAISFLMVVGMNAKTSRERRGLKKQEKEWVYMSILKSAIRVLHLMSPSKVKLFRWEFWEHQAAVKA